MAPWSDQIITGRRSEPGEQGQPSAAAVSRGVRPRSPGRIRLAAAAFAAAYLAALAGAWVAGWLMGHGGILRALPVPGAADRLVILDVSPGSPADRAGLARGDVILATDEAPLPGALGESWSAGRPGERVVLRVLRSSDDSEALADVSAAEVSFVLASPYATPDFFFSQVSYSVVGLAALAVGLFVAVVRPAEPAARRMALASVFLALALAINVWNNLVPLTVLTKAFLSALLLGAAAVLHLFLTFPTRHPLLARLHALGPASLQRVGGGTLLLYATPIGLTATLAEVLRDDLRATLIVATLVFTLSLLALFRSYRHAATGVARAQLRWMTLGLAIGVIGMILGPLFDAVTDYRFRVLPASVTTGLWVFLPISIAVAILRFRLWDIDLIVSRTMVYLPLTAILGGLYIASIALFQRVFVLLTGETSDAAIVLTTLVVASAFTPVRNGLQRVVDSRFKEPRDPARALRGLADQIRSVLQVLDAQQLTSRLLDETTAAFGAECGALYLERARGQRLVLSRGSWSEAQAEIAARLERDGVTLGRIALGPRHGGTAYTEKERAILQETVDLVTDGLQAAGRLTRSSRRPAAPRGLVVDAPTGSPG